MRIIVFIILSILFTQISAQKFSEQEIRDDIQYFQNHLSKIDSVTQEFYQLTYDWVLDENLDSTESRLRLLHFLESDTINQVYNQLMARTYFLTNDLLIRLVGMSSHIHSINIKSRFITNILNSKESYEDFMVVFEVLNKLEYGGSIHLARFGIKGNVEVLNSYCEYLKEQKKIKPLINKDLKPNKHSLIIELFEVCNLRLEINDYISKLWKPEYWYIYSRRDYFESEINEQLLQYYYKEFSFNEINELIEFYKSDIGVKTLKIKGFLSLQLLESVLNEDIYID